MNKIILTLVLMCSAVSTMNARNFIINVKNNSDGMIQVLPDDISMDALKSINTLNPLSEGIMDLIINETQGRLQEALEGATQTSFAPREEAVVSMDFCPLNIIIKKTSGSNAGKQVKFKLPNCRTINVTINQSPSGFDLVTSQ